MAQVDYTIDRTAAAQDAWTSPAQVSDPVLYSSEWAARITAKYFGKPVLDELLALIYSRVASKTYAKLWTCLAGLNVGDPVYISATDTVTLALATTEPTSRVIGFVRSKPSTTTCYIEHYLLKTGLSGLTAGNPVYLTDAGGFGAAAGTVSKTIGYAIDTDEALLSASPAPGGGGTGDHGALSGLADDDHTQYLLAAGTRALSAAWDAGSWQIRAETFQSDVATGTPPLTVASTTAVTNLNADLLDGNHAAAFAAAGAAPTAHAASHITGGADIIAVATTSAVGLTPAATAPGAGLLSVLAIANGETVRTDKAIFDTTNPAALGSAGPGSQVVAARRDHVHAMPSAADVGAIAIGAAPTAHAASHVTGGGDVIADAIAAGNSGLMSGADKTKLNNIETAADVTDATNVAAAGAVMESDYTAADVVLVGTGVGTVGAVTLAASQFLGKKAAGAATNLTATEARTILNVADGANAYVHPNHSGDVTSAADGEQTIGAKKVTIAMLADGTDGQLITWDAAGVAATVAAGTAGHVLTSNGAGAAPTFQAASVADGAITAAKLNTAVLTGLTAETAIADADLMLIDDGAGGTLRKMTRGNVFASGGAFVVREGDPAAWDFTLANFTTDGAAHTLDLSGIIPAGTKGVFIQVYIVDDLLNKSVYFYDPDNSTNQMPKVFASTPIVNVGFYYNLGPVGVNSSRALGYLGDNTTFTNILLMVTGWII